MKILQLTIFLYWLVIYYFSFSSMIACNSLIASAGNWIPAPVIFSRKCLTEDVPGLSRIFGERCNSHASATPIGVALSCAATLFSVSECNGEKPPRGKYGTYAPLA